MLVERNPYDPIEIALPSFWKLMKAGMALSFGAGLVWMTALVLGWIAFLIFAGTVSGFLLR